MNSEGYRILDTVEVGKIHSCNINERTFVKENIYYEYNKV